MITTVPDFVYKPIEERSMDELKATLEMNNRAIKKHSELAKWGNVESRARLREVRAVKKRVEARIKELENS